MKKFCLILLFGLFLSPATGLCQKTNRIPILGDQFYDPIMTHNILSEQIDVVAKKIDEDPDTPGMQHFVEQITVESRLITRFNITLGAIGLIFLVVLGTKFIYSLGEADKLKKYKQEFGWIAMGLVVISAAQFIGFSLFNPVKEIIGGANETGDFVQNLAAKSEQIVQFFFYLAAGVMLINGVMSGYDLIIGSEDEQTIEKEVNFVKSYLTAMILIVMGETIVRLLTFRRPDSNAYLVEPGTDLLGESPNIDTTSVIQYAINEIMGLANFVLTFIGVASLVMLVMASLYYVTSFGNEEQTTRAKNIILGCILGIILGFSSFTISSFFATRPPGDSLAFLTTFFA